MQQSNNKLTDKTVLKERVRFYESLFTRTDVQHEMQGEVLGCEVTKNSPIRLTLEFDVPRSQNGNYLWEKCHDLEQVFKNGQISLSVDLRNPQTRQHVEQQDFTIKVLESFKNNTGFYIICYCLETGAISHHQLNTIVVTEKNGFPRDKYYNDSIPTVRRLVGCYQRDVSERDVNNSIDEDLFRQRFFPTYDTQRLKYTHFTNYRPYYGGIYCLLGLKYLYIGETIHFSDRLREHFKNYKEEIGAIISTGLQIKYDNAEMLNLLIFLFDDNGESKENKLYQHFESIFILCALYMRLEQEILGDDITIQSSINKRQTLDDLGEIKRELLKLLMNLPLVELKLCLGHIERVFGHNFIMITHSDRTVSCLPTVNGVLRQEYSVMWRKLQARYDNRKKHYKHEKRNVIRYSELVQLILMVLQLIEVPVDSFIKML